MKARIYLCTFLLILIVTPSFAGSGGSENRNPDMQQKAFISSWIGLTARNLDEGNSQESYIIINPSSTAGFDLMYDSRFLPGSGPVFYSMAAEEKLSTNCIPDFSSQSAIPFVFIPNGEGSFDIEISGVELIQEQVILYDRLSKAQHNLSLDPVYYFDAEAGQDSLRFEIQFRTAGTENDAEAEVFNLYYSQGSLFYQSSAQGKSFTLMNLEGKLIYKSPGLAEKTGSFPVNLMPGIYLVRVLMQDGLIVRKIFIQ